MAASLRAESMHLIPIPWTSDSDQIDLVVLRALHQQRASLPEEEHQGLEGTYADLMRVDPRATERDVRPMIDGGKFFFQMRCHLQSTPNHSNGTVYVINALKRRPP